MNKIFVFDTGIWVYDTKLLSSPTACALCSAIKRLNASIGVPEIVRKEVNKNIIKHTKSAIDQIGKHYEIIEMLFGQRDDYEVPDINKVKNRFNERLNEIGIKIIDIPIKNDHLIAALDRTINESPPNGPKNQQYKDCLIWEAILEIAKKNEIYFITQDKGFFEQRDPKKGIVTNLLEEIEANCLKLEIFYNAESCLSVLSQVLLDIDKEIIIQDISDNIFDKISNDAAIKGDVLEKFNSGNADFYITEIANKLAVVFELIFNVSNVKNVESEELIGTVRLVKGSCYWNLDSKTPEKINFSDQITLDKNGNKINGHSIGYLRLGGAILGRRTIKHSYRERIGKKTVSDLTL